jgi:pimeloyl-ACP methyl ester carboxylesterase
VRHYSEQLAVQVPREGVVRIGDDIADPRGGTIRTETTFSAHWPYAEKPSIVVVNSFGSGIRTLQGVSRAFALNHDRVIRTYDDRRLTMPPADAIDLRTRTFAVVASEYDEPQTLVGWSTGGAVSLRYARAAVEAGGYHRDRIGAVLLTGSVGLIGPDSPGALAARTSREILRAAASPQILRMGKVAVEVCKYIRANPALCLQELVELAAIDLRDDVEALHTHGVPVGIAAYTRDEIFPLKRMRQYARALGIPRDHYTEIDASHIEMVRSPDVVQQVERFATVLEQAA